MARGKALIVGVSQPLRSSGWNASRLTGVDDDVRTMSQFLKACHFEVTTLAEGEATRDRVLKKIGEARETLSTGDFFVFVYSGHGGRQQDQDFDENDRQDELLLVYDKPIVDDDLATLWKGFKSGVRILTLMDACHSGTMFRKAITRGEIREVHTTPARPPMVGLPKTEDGQSGTTRSSDFRIQADLIHIGACRDSQTAADTSQGGAFTLALLRAMQSRPRDYDQLHGKIGANLASRRQVSELHVFGPGGSDFRKQAPFKIDILSNELIDAAEQLLAEAEAAWGFRGAERERSSPSSRGIIVTRPPKHRLDLVLNGNSITSVRAKTYVLGLFEGVTPAGPAAAIDEMLGGTIRHFVARRMFSAKAGEVFMLPTGNAAIQTDFVLFVGLGQLDQFVAQPNEIQQSAAGNIIRTLIQLGIDEFATVLIGGGSGQTVKETFSNLVAGFMDGLRDVDPGDRVRRVILCETDAERYREMVDLVYSHARAESFDDIRLTIYEQPPTLEGQVRRQPSVAVSPYRTRMFLHVRHQQVDNADSYEAILLTPGGKATAIPSSRQYDPDKRDALLRHLGKESFDVDRFGEKLAELALSGEFIETLGSPIAAKQHLVVVHDAESSKLPWETLRCGKRTLALDGGISRKYLLTGNYSIAKWLEKCRFDKTLDILLIVNPTEDLPGAERGGQDHPATRLGCAAGQGKRASWQGGHKRPIVEGISVWCLRCRALRRSRRIRQGRPRQIGDTLQRRNSIEWPRPGSDRKLTGARVL